MKKWTLTLSDGREVPVEARLQGDRVEVTIGGKSFVISEEEIAGWRGEGVFLDGQLLVSSRKVQRAFELKPFVPSASASDEGHKQLKALFPGKVIQVLPKENSWVESGELLVVMESMKMEYHYQAPKRLFIERVLVREGEVLGKGKEFFTFHE